jgi:MFS-type transporter involved in bile tolerance (Atg22 family)
VALVGGLAAVNQLAPPHRRAELLSAYNLMAYTGVILPVLGFGFISEHIGATAAAVAFVSLLFCVIVFAVIVTAVYGSALAGRPGSKGQG